MYEKIMKKYKDNINVYEATTERLDYIFKEFENIYVAFSGGKDSGLLLNLCIKYIKDHNSNKKIGLFHVDYECQYQKTTEFVERMKNKYKNYLDIYHICLPIKTQNSISMNKGYWRPWNPDEKNMWVRELPKNSINFYNNKFGKYYDESMDDYQFNLSFAEWYSKQKKGKTICLLGIRCDESLDRYTRIRNTFRKYQNQNYLYELKSGCYIGYPIYDWTAKDIWIANGKFDFDYNHIYDLFYQAGLSINEMRVASPFNDCAGNGLKLYKIIEPNLWGKMISRVNGVSFAGIYGGTTAMGWRNITKPSQFTWKEYLQFLLSTLDPKTRFNYETRFATSIRFWREKGGILDDKVIKQLKDKNVPFIEKGRISKKSTKNVIAFEEYPDEINIENFKSVPSFKRTCICILKNDWYCKYMGFTPTKADQSQRKRALEKYKNLYFINNKETTDE